MDLTAIEKTFLVYGKKKQPIIAIIQQDVRMFKNIINCLNIDRHNVKYNYQGS